MLLCSNCRQTVKPVVAIDIDGTLGDHHGHFQGFAETYVDRRLGPDHADQTYAGMWRKPGMAPWDAEPYSYDEEFSDWLGLEKELYRDIKLAYRQGAMKRRMPKFEGASSLTQMMQEAGVEVWLCTTRPYLRLDNIDPDTREWLNRHHINYDGLIYGEDKYHRLADIVGPERVIGVLDDLPEMFDEAEMLGLRPIQKRNGHRNSALREPHATTLLEAYDVLIGRLNTWMRSNGDEDGNARSVSVHQ